MVKANMKLFFLLSAAWTMAAKKRTALASPAGEDACAFDTDNLGCRGQYDFLAPMSADGKFPFSNGQSFSATRSGKLRAVQVAVYAPDLASGPYEVDWAITGKDPATGLPDESDTLGSGTASLPGSTELVLTIDTGKDQDIMLEAGEDYFLLLSTPTATGDVVALNWYGFDSNSDPNGYQVRKDETKGTGWEIPGDSQDLSIKTYIGSGTTRECAEGIIEDFTAVLGGVQVDPDEFEMSSESQEDNEVNLEYTTLKVAKIFNKVKKENNEKACKLLQRLQGVSESWFKGEAEADVGSCIGCLNAELDC